MTPTPNLHEGHHAAANRLAEAIEEATRAALRDDELDLVAGGAPLHDDVYWASSNFLADWRTDPHPVWERLH